MGTLGRALEDGASEVHIMGDTIPVRAHLEKINGYSGHKDMNALIDFAEAMEDSVKKVFVVMGEPKSSLFLVQKLRDDLGIEAYAPERGESVSLSC